MYELMSNHHAQHAGNMPASSRSSSSAATKQLLRVLAIAFLLSVGNILGTIKIDGSSSSSNGGEGYADYINWTLSSAAGATTQLVPEDPNYVLHASSLDNDDAHVSQLQRMERSVEKKLSASRDDGSGGMGGDDTEARPKHSKYSSPPHELSAVVMFRVNFDRDLLNFTHEEIDQWMTYMQYAGVQHFYFYDNCYEEKECVEDRYINDPRVTYTRRPGTEYHKTQNPAYEHHFQNHPKSEYEFLADIDEYPFMPNDLEKDFLLRFARNMTTGQVLIRSWFFGGARESDHPWRAMRYFHKDSEPHGMNSRTKSIYVPKKLERISLHWQIVKGESNRYHVDPSIMRLNHYWCERVDQGKFQVLDKTMAPLIKKVATFAQERGLPTRKGDPPLIVQRGEDARSLPDVRVDMKNETFDPSRITHVYVLGQDQGFGRTNNHLIEVLHSLDFIFDLHGDPPHNQAILAVDGWAKEVLQQFLFDPPRPDLWSLELEMHLSPLVVVGYDRLSALNLSHCRVVPLKSADPFFYIIRNPDKISPTKMERRRRTIWGNLLRHFSQRHQQTYAKLQEYLKTQQEENFGNETSTSMTAPYVVVHSRWLEGQCPERVGPALPKEECFMHPEYIKDILRDLEFRQRQRQLHSASAPTLTTSATRQVVDVAYHLTAKSDGSDSVNMLSDNIPVVFISDGQRREVLSHLQQDPDLGHRLIVPKTTLSSNNKNIGGYDQLWSDTFLALKSAAFVGPRVSTMSTMIGMARVLLGADPSTNYIHVIRRELPPASPDVASMKNQLEHPIFDICTDCIFYCNVTKSALCGDERWKW